MCFVLLDLFLRPCLSVSPPPSPSSLVPQDHHLLILVGLSSALFSCPLRMAINKVLVFAGCQEVRHPVPDLRAVRQPCPQPAGALSGTRGHETQGTRQTPADPAGVVAGGSDQGRDTGGRLQGYLRLQG